VIKNIAIIGGGGKMGSWFSKYFSNNMRINQLVYDINPQSIRSYSNVVVCENITQCISSADLVLLCVPVAQTPSLITYCALKMKSRSILAEISSVKYRTFKALKRVSKKVKPLCIHPMFGPGAPSISQMKILLVPVKNKVTELNILNSIFKGAKITILPDPHTHDEAIAIVLGLTYYMNLVFADTVSHEDLLTLKNASGTTFAIQSLLSESILTDQPDLITSLLVENPFVKKHIQKYLRNALAFSRLVFDRDDRKLKARFTVIKSHVQEQQNLDLAYKQMYQIIEQLKD
jgi:prephenate dehydrogenase